MHHYCYGHRENINANGTSEMHSSLPEENNSSELRRCMILERLFRLPTELRELLLHTVDLVPNRVLDRVAAVLSRAECG